MIYRQTNPETNKMAAESLSEEVNIYNMKKVRVNAQVKAMASFIEGFVNIAYILILLIVVRTSLGTLMMQTFMYLIILPYFALMNTSFNKDRIIENGWKNVFKNLLIKKRLDRDSNSLSKHNQMNRDLQEQVKTLSENNTKHSSNGIVKTVSSGLSFGRKIRVFPEQTTSTDATPSTSKEVNSNTESEPVVSKKDNEPDDTNFNAISAVDKIVLQMIKHTHDE